MSLGIDDQRVRVRSAAGLHGGDLLGFLDVGDVEDAHAAEPLGAHRRLTPCVPQSSRPRVCSTDITSRLPCTETSPWPPGQTIDASSLGFLGVGEVVDVEAVEVADEEVAAAEGEVRVREVEAAPARRRGGLGRFGWLGGGLGVGLGLGVWRPAWLRLRARSVRRPASSGRRTPAAWEDWRRAPGCARPARRSSARA